MSVHGLLIVGREQSGGLAVVKIGESRGIYGGELPNVGPGLNRDVIRRRRLAPISAPMPPIVHRRTIACAGKPSLIAHSHFADDIAGPADGKCGSANA